MSTASLEQKETALRGSEKKKKKKKKDLVFKQTV